MVASKLVLRFAVVSTSITLIFLPYSAVIISHERMNIYAYVSVFEGCLNLFIAYIVSMDLGMDRLVFYSVSLCVSVFIVNMIYRMYCIRNFPECRFKLVFDTDLLKKIGGFSSWNMIGAASGVLKNQGVNILFNMFFGPAVNAAQAVSNQASNLSTKFSNGFMTAMDPQITKSYATGNFNYMYSLVFQGTRMAFFLFFLIALPIFVKTDTIISLWLGNPPLHTVAFIRIMLATLFVNSIFANPLVTVMLASGKIRNYQLVVGGIQTLSFPLAYIMLKTGNSPESALFMVLIIAVLCMVVRVAMLRGMIGFPVAEYIKKVLFPIFSVIFLTLPIPIAAYITAPNGFWWDILVCVTAELCGIAAIWLAGFEKKEKQTVLSKIKTFVS